MANTQAATPISTNIKNIVYVMFENRSFDNLLGWMYDGDDAPDDVVNIPANNPQVKFQGLTPELLTKFSQPADWSPSAKEHPIVRGVQGNWLPGSTPSLDPQETFEPVRAQIYGHGDPASDAPTMKGFLADYSAKYKHWPLSRVQHQILQTYEFDQAPIINSLGRAFGVSDEWFCSIPSQTSINRAFSVIGDSVGYMTQADAKQGRTTALVNNHTWGGPPVFRNPAPFIGDTIWNVLAANGYATEQDWKIYYSDRYYNGFGGHKTSYSYLMFEKLQALITEEDAAAGTDPRYQSIETFYADAENGTLPRFSYIEPKYTWALSPELALVRGNDYHPPSDIHRGEKFLKKIYEKLSESDQWDTTLLIVGFDEHGGTFDHISPPATAIDPGGADCNEESFPFDRYGVRVPMLFISPWVTEHTVIRSDSSRPFDHTSLLSTLLHWFGIEGGEPLGKRTAAAPRFDAVVSDTRRADFTLP